MLSDSVFPTVRPSLSCQRPRLVIRFAVPGSAKDFVRNPVCTNVGIDLCCLDTGVVREGLNFADGKILVQQRGGVAVAKSMGLTSSARSSSNARCA